ncbi:MAG: methionyl-tRNA formyltransferase [Acidimicrobiia bacterium]
MRLLFLGTPADAVPPLHALHAAGHDIAMVVTQPDRRRGRGSDLMPSPVKEAALELGLHVVTPEKSREIVEEVVALNVDLGVVVAFGQILPPALLEAVPHGFVNVHFSLLPRWRGAAPVERAMLAGDPETGVCIMRLEEGLDTGPVFARTETPIAPGETAGELHHRLVALGTELLVETLPLVPQVTPFPQEGEVTYASKLEVEEFHLDWTRPAAELELVVRAGNPRPGAFTSDRGRRLKIWSARAHMMPAGAAPGTVLAAPHSAPHVATGKGVLELVEVQPEGKARMSGDAWLAGRQHAPEPLGS